MIRLWLEGLYFIRVMLFGSLKLILFNKLNGISQTQCVINFDVGSGELRKETCF